MRQRTVATTVVSVLTGLITGCGGGSSQNAGPVAGLSGVSSPRLFHASQPACFPAWTASQIYTASAVASENGTNFTANWWTRGNDPATSNGGSGSGQPWVSDGVCGAPASSSTSTPVSTPTPSTCPAFPQWSAATVYTSGAQVSEGGISYQANWWTRGNDPATSNGGSGSGQPWTVMAGCTPSTTVPLPPPVLLPPPPPQPKPKTGNASGTIQFHLLLGVGTAQDQLILDGGHYNDLVMSNLIAGVMLGHLLQEHTPGLQFDPDHLYGSILGQLLQENIATEYYDETQSVIDPSPNQAAVMGVGQGGPYQINNYAADMVSGTYSPQGHSLINYVALQQNIGFTFATAAAQNTQPTPNSFNNKYFGPMLVAYFHYNDFVSLIDTGAGLGGWQTPWQPAFDNAVANFVKVPGNFLDIVLNVAYNQGYYGGLVEKYSQIGALITPSTIATVDSYASVWGVGDSYQQYPYQVHYYDDQFYDNPIPISNPSTLTTTGNHVFFDMNTLQFVFAQVFQKLSYAGAGGHLTVITASQAQAAFQGALQGTGTAPSASLDLANGSQRQQIFSILEQGITGLENTLGIRFNTTTLMPLP